MPEWWVSAMQVKSQKSEIFFGYAGEISKIRNFSGWQKKYNKSENYR
jgi:hypothetical protein